MPTHPWALRRPPGQCGPSPRGVGNETAFQKKGGDYAHFASRSRCRTSMQCRLKSPRGRVCRNSLFPTRKLLEDSFDERAGMSYTKIAVYMSPSLYLILAS